MKEAALRAQLVEGIDQMGLSVSESTIDRMMAYLFNLIKWNKTFNLTSITEPEQMVTDHLLDALSVLPYVSSAKTLLDVGTGPGIPGILIALCRPDIEVTLLDANSKKTAFLRQMAIELQLSTLEIATTRVERFEHALYDTIISRAFSALKTFVISSEHLLAENGRWLAMKGKSPQQEIEELPSQYKISDMIALSVPYSSAERHLMIVQRNSEYPLSLSS